MAGLVFTQAVSHQWERAQCIRDLRAGRILREEVCDADFLLRAAAQHHGVELPKACPVCGAESMRLTRWVYGDSLGRRAGSARRLSEIAEFAAEGLEFTVHTVEVCPACRWNYLLETAEARHRTA